MSRVALLCGPSGAGNRARVVSRVQDRKNEQADDFVLDDALVMQYVDDVEAPTPDEGPLTVIR